MTEAAKFEYDVEHSAFVLGASWQAEQFEKVVAIRAQIAALEAEEVRVLAGLLLEAEGESAETAVDDGAIGDAARRHDLMVRSMATELAASTNTSVRAAEARFGEAWTLSNELCATLSALASGEVSRAHVHEIITETAHLAQGRVEAEAALLPWAKRLAVSPFKTKAKRVLETLERTSLHERHQRAFANRGVQVTCARDGMARLDAYLDAADAALIRTGLDGAAAEARGAGDARTTAQLRADFLVELLVNGVVTINHPGAAVVSGSDPAPAAGGQAVTPGGMSRATVKQRAAVSVDVLIPASTLAGRNDEGAIIPGFGVIDPARARELVALAPSLRRILTDPITAAIVDFDRATYRVPAELKRVLRLRDGRCRAPGCSVPIANTELDHTKAAARGGPTALWNLAHLCDNHHHLKHEAGWSLIQYVDGALDWRAPSGRSYMTYPELDVSGPRANVSAQARADPWNPPDTGEKTPFDLPKTTAKPKSTARPKTVAKLKTKSTPGSSDS